MIWIAVIISSCGWIWHPKLSDLKSFALSVSANFWPNSSRPIPNCPLGRATPRCLPPQEVVAIAAIPKNLKSETPHLVDIYILYIYIIILYYIILYYIMLYYIIILLYYIILYYIISYSMTLPPVFASHLQFHGCAKWMQ